MSIYDVFFGREDDEDSKLSPTQQQLARAARRGGYKIDSERLLRVIAHLDNQEIAQGYRDAEDDHPARRGQAVRQDAARQEAIRLGYLPPEDNETPG